MYPNSAISAGAMMAVAFTVMVALAIWLGAVFYVARGPRHHHPKS